MSELGQWLFQKEKAAIKAMLDMRAPRSGTVLSIVTSSHVTFTDAATGQPWPTAVPVIGQLPAVGERVLVLVVGDGSRVAIRAAAMQAILNTQAPDYVVADAMAQSSSNTASTTSTVNFSVAGTLSLALPPGTWRVAAIGGQMLKHSAGSASFQINIDGDQGQIETLALTIEGTAVSKHELAGVVGDRSIDINVRFRSSTAGTTNSRNPWAWATAVRTGA
jgi:hypothetical protein